MSIKTQTKHTNGAATLLIQTIVPSLVHVHTNFDLRPYQGLSKVLEDVVGVEDIYITKKYEISCFFGKSFDTYETAMRVKDMIWDFIGLRSQLDNYINVPTYLA